MRPGRDKLLDSASNDEERALLARVLDQVEAVRRSGLTQVTGFYDPYHTGLIISK